MDRLDEIRQRVENRQGKQFFMAEPEAFAWDDSPAKKLKELDELLEASKAGQVSLQKAWEQDKAEPTARAEKAEAERDTYKAALEALHINADLLKGE